MQKNLFQLSNILAFTFVPFFYPPNFLQTDSVIANLQANGMKGNAVNTKAQVNNARCCVGIHANDSGCDRVLSN